MTQRKEKEKKAIDVYYGENQGDPLDQEMDDFFVVMSQSLDKMKIDAEDTLTISLDEMINNGLQRKAKKQKQEMRAFIFSAIIIILSLPLWMVVLGMKTILLWQWFLLIPVTLVILPLMKNGKGKEVG